MAVVTAQATATGAAGGSAKGLRLITVKGLAGAAGAAAAPGVGGSIRRGLATASGAASASAPASALASALARAPGTSLAPAGGLAGKLGTATALGAGRAPGAGAKMAAATATAVAAASAQAQPVYVATAQATAAGATAVLAFYGAFGGDHPTTVNLWTAAWAEAQASASADLVEVFCLELIHPAFVTAGGVPAPVRACADLVDHLFLHEGNAPLDPGATVTYTAIPFSAFWPEIEDGKTPELTIRIDNIGRELAPYLDAATAMEAPITMIARVYLVDPVGGTSAAAIDPITFSVRSVVVTDTYVEAKASPADLSNLQGMRLVYDLTTYPGLYRIAA